MAEYAVAGVPSICMPYPHHKDRHQYFNAGKLVEVGAAVIVDDVPDLQDRADWLWEELEDLMTRRRKTPRNVRKPANKSPAPAPPAKSRSDCSRWPGNDRQAVASRRGSVLFVGRASPLATVAWACLPMQCHGRDAHRYGLDLGRKRFDNDAELCSLYEKKE